MKKILTSFCTVIILAAPVLAQETVFDHDFENSTPGDVFGAGALGAPAFGSVTATGGFVSTTLPAYTTGSNSTSNAIATIADGSFDDVGTPAGNFLTANLSSPAAVTGTLGAGQTTTVNFELAVFGTNNTTDFKYTHVRGLSSAGAEVFQLVYRAGSFPGAREVYARELVENNTTFAEGAYSSTDGSLILDDIEFGFNGTNTDSAPTGKVAVSITIDDSGWNASAATTTVGVDENGDPSPQPTAVETPATGLSIASGATDLASIVFFTSHNANTGNQNKGLWLDNVLVETDLTVVSGVPGDYNNDGDVDGDDVDLLSAQLGNPASANPLMNLDADDTITLADHDLHITTLVQDANGTGALIGDLNLDGDVDVSQISIVGGGVVNVGDASVLLANLGTETGAGYAEGDLNADGDVDVSQISIVGGSVVNVGDASILLANLGQTTAAAPAASAVPEPGSLSLLAVAAIGLVSRRMRS